MKPPAAPPPRQGRFVFIVCSLSLLLFIISALATTRVLRRVTAVEVPEVVNKSVEAARSLLRVKRLDLEIAEFRFDQRLPANQIMSQDPAAGQSVKSGRRVRVVVSRGAQAVKMPELVGQSLREAQVELGKKSLTAGKISRWFSESPKDTVLAQQPAAGQATTGSSRVELLISAGARPMRWVMPDLRGRSQQEAVGVFRALGLEVRDIQHRVTDRQASGTVLEQNPAPGERLEPGRPLALVTAQSPGEQQASSRYVTIRYRVPAGTSEVRIKMDLSDQNGWRVIYNTMERPNANLTLRTTVYGTDATLSISVNGQVVEERKL